MLAGCPDSSQPPAECWQAVQIRRSRLSRVGRLSIPVAAACRVLAGCPDPSQSSRLSHLSRESMNCSAATAAARHGDPQVADSTLRAWCRPPADADRRPRDRNRPDRSEKSGALRREVELGRPGGAYAPSDPEEIFGPLRYATSTAQAPATGADTGQTELHSAAT